MKKTKYSALALLAASMMFAGNDIGVVNMTKCIAESQVGQSEQASFEALKKQMTDLIKDVDDQLKEVAEKLQDEDYMDTLSPQAEKELKTKYQTLAQDIQRYQQQYYQAIQQANMKLMQTVASFVQEASKELAKEKSFKNIISNDACFYSDENSDVTADVIQKMDSNYAKLQAKAAPQVAEAQAQK